MSNQWYIGSEATRSLIDIDKRLKIRNKYKDKKTLFERILYNSEFFEKERIFSFNK